MNVCRRAVPTHKLSVRNRPTSRHSRPLSTAFIRASVAGHNLLMTWRPVPPGRHRDYRLEDNNQTVAIALTSYRLQSANGMARDRFSNNQKL